MEVVVKVVVKIMLKLVVMEKFKRWKERPRPMGIFCRLKLFCNQDSNPFYHRVTLRRIITSLPSSP